MKIRNALLGLMSGLLFMTAGISMSQAASAPIGGLTAYYPFNGNAEDESGNSNHGTPNNGAVLTSDRFGTPNAAFLFDGINDNIYIGTGLISPYALTIAAWFQQTSVPTFNKWRDLVAGNCGTVLLSLDYYQNRPAFGGQCDAPFPMTNAAPVTDTNWHHVVATYGSGQVKVYVDGNLAMSRYLNGPFNVNVPLYIGAALGNGAEAFAGSIDEVYLYNRALTASEVDDVYNADSPADTDGDGFNDDDDNCPDDSNPGQTDTDLDGAGDACDNDDDNDGVADGDDNCQFTANPDQINSDMDLLGDLCDSDRDGDTICDVAGDIGCTGGPDNCPVDPNPFQTDTDNDGAGDECDEDDDNDGVCDTDQVGDGCAAGPDNCPTLANPGQTDSPDGDGIGDLCDADDDNDGSDDIVDNCPVTANADQNDTDGDMTGDACDTDDDGDGVLDDADNCQFVVNSDQLDADGDGIGDACNDANDRDGDDWSDSLDNCPDDPNSSQNDLDVDGEGDACDPDIDGDGAANGLDLCAATPSGELANPANGCTLAQLCPCDGPRGTNSSWKNHGKYVSCVAHAANDFRDAGLIFDSEHGDIVSAAGQSACGNKNK